METKNLFESAYRLDVYEMLILKGGNAGPGERETDKTGTEDGPDVANG